MPDEPKPTPETSATPAPAAQVPAPEPASPVAEQAPAPETSSPQAAGAEAKSEATNEAPPSALEEFAAKRAEDGTEKPAEAEKSAEDAKAEGEKKDQEASAATDEPKPEAPKPELPKVDYKYELPESITMDDGQKQQFHEALDAFRAEPEKGAQNLIGMADKMMHDFAEHLTNEQWRAFNDMRATWRKEMMADPVIGGAGHDTAMGVIARMRDKFASDSKPGTEAYDKDLKDFDLFLRTTGAGDNPHFLRFLHRVGRKFDEPPMPPPGARPVPDGGRRPGESRGSRMYPTMQSDSQS